MNAQFPATAILKILKKYKPPFHRQDLWEGGYAVVDENGNFISEREIATILNELSGMHNLEVKDRG